MIRNRFLILLLAALLIQLQGCGFHLRGTASHQLGQTIPALHLAGLDSETGFGRTLAQVLSANGVELQNQPSNEIPTLNVKPLKLTRQVLSVDREIRAREYVLISTVSYTLSGASVPINGKPIGVSVRRELVVDPNRILGSDQEERRLRKEMEQELAQLLALRLRL